MIADLAHERAAVVPHAQQLPAATVAQAVRGDLVDGEDEVGGPVGGEAGLDRAPADSGRDAETLVPREP